MNRPQTTPDARTHARTTKLETWKAQGHGTHVPALPVPLMGRSAAPSHQAGGKQPIIVAQEIVAHALLFIEQRVAPSSPNEGARRGGGSVHCHGHEHSTAQHEQGYSATTCGHAFMRAQRSSEQRSPLTQHLRDSSFGVRDGSLPHQLQNVVEVLVLREALWRDLACDRVRVANVQPPVMGFECRLLASCIAAVCRVSIR